MRKLLRLLNPQFRKCPGEITSPRPNIKYPYVRGSGGSAPPGMKEKGVNKILAIREWEDIARAMRSFLSFSEDISRQQQDSIKEGIFYATSVISRRILEGHEPRRG